MSQVNTTNGSSQFYDGKMQYWNYFAFVLDQKITEGQVDLKPFIDYLINHRLISGNHYLASVEFGNEIAYGRGPDKSNLLFSEYFLNSSQRLPALPTISPR